MPVIKSISYKSRGFGNLLAYLHRPDSRGLLEYMTRAGSSAIEFTYLHNIFSCEPDNLAGIQAAFAYNDTFRKERKNGNQVYQDILSFHGHDRDYLLDHPEVLWEVAELYLDKRAANSLGVARVHTDTEKIHLHFMISANQVESDKATHLTQVAFKEVKQAIEVHVRSRHPILEASEVNHTISVKKLTKQQLVEVIKAELAKANHRGEWLEVLSARGYEVYERSGRPEGLVIDGRKSRFTTLLGLKYDPEGKAEFADFMNKEPEPEPVLSPLQYELNELRAIRFRGQAQSLEKAPTATAWESLYLRTASQPEAGQTPTQDAYQELADLRDRSRSDDDREREFDDD